MASGALTSVAFHLGDSSSLPCLSDAEVASLQEEFGRVLKVTYRSFGANRGSAGGQNDLAAINAADLLFIQNPDVIASPRMLETLIEPLKTAGVGIAEAKQLPVEHPKDYDPKTGETSWAMGACLLIPARLFKSINGFDADSFFMYCDDVDLSWRTKLAGFKVIHHPAAVVFHDKRLSADAKWMPSAAERYYSAEAALFMAHKWSKAGVLQRLLEQFSLSPHEDHQKAYSVFMSRREADQLPAPLDPGHEVGQFVGDMYAHHRFALL
ncbi:glycosyltransferase family 2 protein [Chelatococcus reniformis]|nr:glycosyltransferase family 2 protein [Chelatococcus reniformis]